MKVDATIPVQNPAPRILIVDDHPLFLSAMQSIFHLHMKSARVSVADSLAQVRKLVRHAPKPDLVFLDLELPDSHGLDTVRLVSDLLPQATLVVLTGYAREADKQACLDLGAHEVLDKSMRQDGLVNAVLNHTENLTHPVQDKGVAPAAQARLSQRQHDVLALIVQGYSNRDIAVRLHITESTVKAHTSAIFRSLGVRTRAEVIARSVQQPGH